MKILKILIVLFAVQNMHAHDLMHHPLRSKFVSFVSGMGHSLLSNEVLRYQLARALADKKHVKNLEAVYAKNYFTQLEPQATPLIPKIIHQIWLGSPLPEKYKAYQATILKHHPDWKYILWTDEEVKKMFPLKNQQYFDKATLWAEKADILRYEIVYNYGGVYLDMDMEGVQSLDILHHTYKFYAGVFRPSFSGAEPPVYLNNAVIGAVAGHAILRWCIDGISQHAHEKSILCRTGTTLFTHCFFKYLEQDTERIIGLPANFFYVDSQAKATERTFLLEHGAVSWMVGSEKEAWAQSCPSYR